MFFNFDDLFVNDIWTRKRTTHRNLESYPCSLDLYQSGLNRDFENKYWKHPLITAIKKGYVNIAILMIKMGIGNTAEEYKIVYVARDRNGQYGQREYPSVAAVAATAAHPVKSSRDSKGKTTIINLFKAFIIFLLVVLSFLLSFEFFIVLTCH